MWKLTVGAVLLLAGELWGVPSKYTIPADTTVAKRVIADSLTTKRMRVTGSIGSFFSSTVRSTGDTSYYSKIVDLYGSAVLVEVPSSSVGLYYNAKIVSPASTKAIEAAGGSSLVMAPAQISMYTAPAVSAGASLVWFEKLRLASSNSLPAVRVIGDSAAGCIYAINSNTAFGDSAKYFFVGNTVAGERVRISQNGNMYNVNGVYGVLSDSSVKMNIKSIDTLSTHFSDIQIKEFAYKEDSLSIHYGVVAQEIQRVYPHLVQGVPSTHVELIPKPDGGVDTVEKVGTILTVNVAGFIPILIEHAQKQDKAISELQVAVAGLLTALAGLGVLVQSLRKKLNALIALHPEAGVTEEEK